MRSTSRRCWSSPPSSAKTWINSDEYRAIKPIRTDNSTGPVAMFAANMLPDGFDTSTFGAYISTIKKFKSPRTRRNRRRVSSAAKGEQRQVRRHDDRARAHARRRVRCLAVLRELRGHAPRGAHRLSTCEGAVAYLSDPSLGLRKPSAGLTRWSGPSRWSRRRRGRTDRSRSTAACRTSVSSGTEAVESRVTSCSHVHAVHKNMRFTSSRAPTPKSSSDGIFQDDDGRSVGISSVVPRR